MASKYFHFFRHDAICQAVIENAFDILEYFLQTTCQNHPLIHEPNNCPVRVALKYAKLHPSKLKCLVMLLQYGYTCSCISRIGQDDKMDTGGKAVGEYYCSEVVNFVGSEHFRLSIETPVTLFNLSRRIIRHHLFLSTNNLGNKETMFHKIMQFPLPNKLHQALLFKDYRNYEISIESTSVIISMKK